jgi:hypothetical protein
MRRYSVAAGAHRERGAFLDELVAASGPASQPNIREPNFRGYTPSVVKLDRRDPVPLNYMAARPRKRTVRVSYWTEWSKIASEVTARFSDAAAFLLGCSGRVAIGVIVIGIIAIGIPMAVILGMAQWAAGIIIGGEGAIVGDADMRSLRSEDRAIINFSVAFGLGSFFTAVCAFMFWVM